jgi:hypothetical protein
MTIVSVGGVGGGGVSPTDTCHTHTVSRVAVGGRMRAVDADDYCLSGVAAAGTTQPTAGGGRDGSNSSRDSDTGSETGQRRDDYCTRTCASSWCQRTEVSTRTVNRVDCVAKWWLWQVRHIPQPVAAATVVLAAGTAIPAARRGNTEVTIGHAPAPVAGASVQRYQHMSSAEHRCPSRHGVADRARGCEGRTQTTIVSVG